jgi:RNA polymerase sigma-70 factor (ECF subfamily)
MGPVDPGNFTRWFDGYAARLVLYARQWLPAGEAEDAVQEVFVRLMRQRAAPDNPAAWLFTAVRREAADRCRSNTSRRRRERVVAQGRRGWFENDPAAPIDAASAESAIAELPASQREIVVLRVWGGLSFSAIAEVTGSPLSTVFDQYQAGLAGIRQRMGSPCNRTIRKTN